MDDASFARLEAQVTAITRPAPALLAYYVCSAITTTVLAPFFLVYLYFRYHTLHYRFDEDGVSMGYGVLFRREMHLTYARMQDIHLSQNVVERWLGIGAVTVQTAGGGEGGDLRIVGVREFEAIRDYLYARMRGVRPAARAAAGPAGADEVALLAAIRDELRAAARALGGSAS
ncbi:MAG TPA: PH domain-containing protein [Polyangia bacterium]|jgi:putative membrane protein